MGHDTHDLQVSLVWVSPGEGDAVRSCSELPKQFFTR